MDKEKEIEKMTEYLVQNGIFNNLVCRQDYAYPAAMIYECCRQAAELLINSGIGNVKQAVKEFASNMIDLLGEMGMERSSEYNDGYDDGVADCITNIKSQSTELYGADE